MTATSAPASHAGGALSLPPARALRRAAARALTAIAVARMERALTMIPPRQLAAMGIARADILAHAAHLVGAHID